MFECDGLTADEGQVYVCMCSKFKKKSLTHNARCVRCIATSYHWTADKTAAAAWKPANGKQKQEMPTYLFCILHNSQIVSCFFLSNCQYYVLYTAQHTVSRLCRKHATDVPRACKQVSLSMLS